MDMIKMRVEEGKVATVYSFGFAYVTKEQDIKWNDDVIVASRDKNSAWTFRANAVKSFNQNELEVYKTLVSKVGQVVDTNGMNLSGIKMEKVAAKAK
jgi:hypothetical protein